MEDGRWEKSGCAAIERARSAGRVMTYELEVRLLTRDETHDGRWNDVFVVAWRFVDE